MKFAVVEKAGTGTTDMIDDDYDKLKREMIFVQKRNHNGAIVRREDQANSHEKRIIN